MQIIAIPYFYRYLIIGNYQCQFLNIQIYQKRFVQIVAFLQKKTNKHRMLDKNLGK